MSFRPSFAYELEKHISIRQENENKTWKENEEENGESPPIDWNLLIKRKKREKLACLTAHNHGSFSPGPPRQTPTHRQMPPLWGRIRSAFTYSKVRLRGLSLLLFFPLLFFALMMTVCLLTWYFSLSQVLATEIFNLWILRRGDPTHRWCVVRSHPGTCCKVRQTYYPSFTSPLLPIFLLHSFASRLLGLFLTFQQIRALSTVPRTNS